MEALLLLIDTLASGAELLFIDLVLTALDFLSGIRDNRWRRLVKRGAKYGFHNWIWCIAYVVTVLCRIWRWSERLESHVAFLSDDLGAAPSPVINLVAAVVLVCIIEWLKWRHRNM